MYFRTYLDESSAVLSEQVQTEEIEWVFRYGWTLCDRGAFFLHKAQQFVEKWPPIGVIVHLIQPRQAVRAPGRRLCRGK